MCSSKLSRARKFVWGSLTLARPCVEVPEASVCRKYSGPSWMNPAQKSSRSSPWGSKSSRPSVRVGDFGSWWPPPSPPAVLLTAVLFLPEETGGAGRRSRDRDAGDFGRAQEPWEARVRVGNTIAGARAFDVLDTTVKVVTLRRLVFAFGWVNCRVETLVAGSSR